MRKENLVGKRFGRLLVVEEQPSQNKKQKRPSWKCLCNCGEITIVDRGCKLKNGNTKSCGCLKSEKSSQHLTNVGFSRRKYEPIVAAARTAYLAKYNDGTLTFDEFYKLSQLNCFYCGRKPSNKWSNRTNYDEVRKMFIYNGLDRVNNDLPHNSDNCVPSCKECNFSKRNMGTEQFYAMVVNINSKNHSEIPNYEKLYLANNHDLPQFKRIKGTLKQAYKDIDIDFALFSFILTQPCFYCGISNSNQTKCKNGDIILRNGIDRLDQTKPHTLDNIVSCCKFCNWSKANRSMAEFISWAKRVYFTCPAIQKN